LCARDYVMLAIADTGTGMSDEVKAHLFEPFFTTKEAGKGTGLGLATCYGIVCQLGGKIDVQSEPGSGSVFGVYVPLAAAAPESKQAPAAAAPAAGGETVLLVEDDPALRSLARTVLEEAGYGVL